MKKAFNVKSLVLLVISLAFLILAGCSSISLGISVGELKGIVTDARSGSNLQGVYVEAYSDDYYYDEYDSDWDYTDSSGSYSLSLEGGIYDVYFEKDGYYSELFRDIGVSSPFSRNLDVQMTPLSTPSPTISPTASPTPADTVYGGIRGAGRFTVSTLMSDGRLETSSLSPVNLASEPAGLLGVETKSRLYAVTGADGTAGQVTSFDTADMSPTGASIDLISAVGQAYRIVHHTDTDRLYVSRRGTTAPGQLEEIILDGDTVTAQNIINLSADDPQSMAVDQDAGILYVAMRESGRIIAYDINAGAEAGFIDGVEDPAGIALQPERKRLFVVSGSGGYIRTIDVTNPASMVVLGNTAINKTLLAVALDTQFNRLFTAEKDGTVFRVRAFNVNSDPSPSHSQVSTPVFWNNAEPRCLLYLRGSRMLLVSTDNSPNGGGIRVYDCTTYPAGQMLLVDGSPFFSDESYFMLTD